MHRASSAPEEGRGVLGYALTFLIVALLAGILGVTEVGGLAGDVAWFALVALFVLTLAAALARATRRLTHL
jgi:uncharacterized membrane protein YtjA (UPF0391 family)